MSDIHSSYKVSIDDLCYSILTPKQYDCLMNILRSFLINEGDCPTVDYDSGGSITKNVWLSMAGCHFYRCKIKIYLPSRNLDLPQPSKKDIPYKDLLLVMDDSILFFRSKNDFIKAREQDSVKRPNIFNLHMN